MGRKCTICSLPAPVRDCIEGLIQSGETFQNLSKIFKIDPQAIRRHSIDHMELPEKPKAGEVVAVFEHVSSSRSWNEYSLTNEEKVIGSLYLTKGLMPVTKSIRLKKKGISGSYNINLA